MPHATTPDGVKLYYEEAGAGPAILFVHEYCGDWRAWEPQMRFFARKYPCITYSFRGYPGSDVPKSAAVYGQKFAVDDARHMLDHLKIAKAHVVGPGQQFGGEMMRGRAKCLKLGPFSDVSGHPEWTQFPLVQYPPCGTAARRRKSLWHHFSTIYHHFRPFIRPA